MGLKRYIFESGLDIIAPMKCGTRWLEGFDVENRIRTFGLHPTDLKEHIHSGTTFIWRPVREHFISAVRTDWALAPDRGIWDIVTKIEEGNSSHWHPHLYRELYPLWEKTGFRFYKLRALSEITPSAGELKWTSNIYKFALPTEWDSVEAALGSLSPKHTKRLEKLISEEEKWLKMMIEAQYSEKNWEAYSDLEDSRLEMLCKSMDLKAEVEFVKETFVNQMKSQRINHLELTKSLYKEISELKDSNTKIQNKLDYTEIVMGKPPIKLI